MSKKFFIKPPEQLGKEKALRQIYNRDRENKNNLSYWFPKLESAKMNNVALPQTRIISIPPEIMGVFYEDNFEEHQEQVDKFVEEKIKSQFRNSTTSMFVKNRIS